MLFKITNEYESDSKNVFLVFKIAGTFEWFSKITFDGFRNLKTLFHR